MRMLIYVSIILCLLVTNNLISQNSGRGFNFQSILRDKDGQILRSKPVQIFIRYYWEGTSTTLFEESQNLTTDDFGAISTVCGYGQRVSGSLANFSDINFSAGNVWYAVSIMDGGVKREIANQSFHSVPYAETAFNVSPNPPGTILPFAGETVPAGYLACDGSEYSKSQYPALFNVIQNIWGTASNNNNFRVPDLRGLFLRGVDGTAGRDPDKNSRTALRSGQNSGNRVGSYQAHAVGNHTHTNYQIQTAKAPSSGGYNLVRASTSGTVEVATGATRTGNRSTENRPSNINVLYIIKF